MPYLTRLYWAGGKGYARLDGEEIRLTAPPQCLPGVTVDSIDYVPGGVCMVMPRFNGWTDLEGPQIAAADAFLRGLFK